MQFTIETVTMEHQKNEMAYVPNEKKAILTITELASYTGYSINYLYKLCSQRKIPHYNPEGGRRLFFCISEIILWLSKNKIKTIQEIEALSKD
jgi:excisionase family DNA binding protein